MILSFFEQVLSLTLKCDCRNMQNLIFTSLVVLGSKMDRSLCGVRTMQKYLRRPSGMVIYWCILEVKILENAFSCFRKLKSKFFLVSKYVINR